MIRTSRNSPAASIASRRRRHLLETCSSWGAVPTGVARSRRPPERRAAGGIDGHGNETTRTPPRPPVEVRTSTASAQDGQRLLAGRPGGDPRPGPPQQGRSGRSWSRAWCSGSWPSAPTSPPRTATSPRRAAVLADQYLGRGAARVDPLGRQPAAAAGGRARHARPRSASPTGCGSCPGWVLDAVLVHELAHLIEPTHSARFRRLAEPLPPAPPRPTPSWPATPWASRPPPEAATPGGRRVDAPVEHGRGHQLLEVAGVPPRHLELPWPGGSRAGCRTRR